MGGERVCSAPQPYSNPRSSANLKYPAVSITDPIPNSRNPIFIIMHPLPSNLMDPLIKLRSNIESLKIKLAGLLQRGSGIEGLYNHAHRSWHYPDNGQEE